MRKHLLSLLAVTFLALPLCAQNRISPVSAIVDNPTITIAGAAADSTSTPTTGMHQAHIVAAFGTVSGTYTTCTFQAQTSYDGTNFLTLGATATVAFTTNTKTAWDLYAQIPSTSSVTLTTPSTTLVTNFGLYTRWHANCSVFGTSAPVTLTVVYTP